MSGPGRVGAVLVALLLGLALIGDRATAYRFDAQDLAHSLEGRAHCTGWAPTRSGAT